MWREFKIISYPRENYETAKDLGLKLPEGEIGRITIDLSQVESFREDEMDFEGKDIQSTTVTLKSGDYCTLLIAYREFRNLINK